MHFRLWIISLWDLFKCDLLFVYVLRFSNHCVICLVKRRLHLYVLAFLFLKRSFWFHYEFEGKLFEATLFIAWLQWRWDLQLTGFLFLFLASLNPEDTSHPSSFLSIRESQCCWNLHFFALLSLLKFLSNEMYETLSGRNPFPINLSDWVDSISFAISSLELLVYLFLHLQRLSWALLLAIRGALIPNHCTFWKMEV